MAPARSDGPKTAVSYTHLRAHETKANLVCRLLLEKKKQLGVFSGLPPTAEEKARSVAYLQEVAPYAEERGVTIALEYLGGFEMYLTNIADDLAALVREVDHSHCRMM